MQFALFVTAWLLCLSCIAECLEIYPGFHVIQNDEMGLHVYNYFTLYNYEFRYTAIFIDDHKLPKCNIVDRVHHNVALTALQSEEEHHEVFVRTYKFPRLDAGIHAFRLVLCEKLNPNRRATPVLQIHVTMLCEPMPLLFYTYRPIPCLCRFLPDSSQLVQRQDWLYE